MRLFNWAGVSATGAFAVSSPYVWDTSKLYTSGEVTFLAAAGLPGDFNSDGAVNAADYIILRKGLGTTYTQAAYDVWRSHFGQTAGSGSAGVVPEPNALLHLGFVLVAMVAKHRARTMQRGGEKNY